MLIAITMGDSAGVGPEIILRAHQKHELPEDFVVVGDWSVMTFCDRLLKIQSPLRKVTAVEEREPGSINILDLALLKTQEIQIGQISKLSGYSALQYVELATKLALQHAISAIVTLPINKEATRLSTPGFSGHTEYIAALCGESNYTMLLVSEKLAVTHVSTHVALREAIAAVTRERVGQVIRLTHGALKKIRSRQRIAVAGLNPHAGENGAFGWEEDREIAPAIAEARAEGIEVSGPMAPDTIFLQATKGKYDAVVCMYHDQGHIPMKLLDFEGGINVTLGLPIVRTSVDHGTAFDIAYQGIAFTRSLREACQLAVKLVQTT